VHEKVKNCFEKKCEKANKQLNATPADTVTAGDVTKEKLEKKVDFKCTLKLPYVPRISEGIHKITKKLLNDKVRVVFTSENTLRKNLMHVKPKTKPILKNCVYQIECECHAKYIGQTKRPLTTRVKEHQKALNHEQNEHDKNHNRLALHAQKMKHKFDFVNTTVIHFEKRWNKRVVAESMAMVAKDNVISQSSRNIDKIFWRNIKNDEKSDRGKKKRYFCEKARLNDVTAAAAVQNVSQNTAVQPPLPPPNTAPKRPLHCSYFFRTRAGSQA
jgi:predicted GIY-YIG superfamily endonuclease